MYVCVCVCARAHVFAVFLYGNISDSVDMYFSLELYRFIPQPQTNIYVHTYKHIFHVIPSIQARIHKHYHKFNHIHF